MPCGREHVIVTGRNDADMIAETWDALVANNEPPRLFRYGDALCDVAERRVRVLSAELMGWKIAQDVELERVTKTGTQPVSVPGWLERKMLAVRDGRLPELARVSRVPVLAADGSLREHRGYDFKTRVWYEPDVPLPQPVPQAPTEEQVTRSRDFIVGELLCDFPFETESDRTGAFALFLLPFARELLGDSPTPLHFVTKPDVGAGATTLVQVCLAPGLGRVPPSVNVGTNAEELEKVLLSIARAGGDSVFLDNVTTLKRQSPALAQAITSRAVEGRVLGISQMASLPFSPIWTATGNNPDLTSELRRRTCPIRLAVWSERPWEREWRHPDVVEWVRGVETRGRAAWAALVVLRGWLAAGGPGWPGAGASGFGRWADVVGGVCGWLGLGSFLANRETVIDAAEDREDWDAIVACAARVIGLDLLFRSEDLYSRALTDGGAAALAGGAAANPVRALGNALRRNAGRVSAGRTIVAVEGHRPRSWVVREVVKRA